MYALLVTIATLHGVTVAQVGPFPDRDACQVVAQVARQDAQRVTYGKGDVVTSCVPLRKV